LLGGHRALLAVILLLPCVAAPLMRLLHGRGGGTRAPWRHAYAVITYLACVPGMLAAVLTGYVVLFSRENLLDLDLLVFVAPLVTMSAALLLIRRNVSFNDVPGFDRLAGLMVMLAGAFIVTLVLARLRVLLIFGGTIASFLLLAGLVFAFMKWGAHLLMRRADEPRQEPPVIPGL
jgi:hypothetical protein